MMIIRPINLGSGTDMIDIADTSNKAKETPSIPKLLYLIFNLSFFQTNK